MQPQTNRSTFGRADASAWPSRGSDTTAARILRANHAHNHGHKAG